MDFDEDDALARTAGDRELLGQVIRFTVEDFRPLLAEIRKAAAAGLHTEASKLAHKVKGSAGACGARRLYLAALDMEMAAKDAADGYENLTNPLEEAFAAFTSHPRVREIASLDAEADASIG